MSREYDQLAWVDYPETLTPISAANLNRMENGIANLYTDRNKMENNIAYVEEGETATRHYFINSYLMLNGIFYKTTSEINIGDILDPTLAGNIEHVDVSSQFGSGGGGSTGCVELTQAQYDDVSHTEDNVFSRFAVKASLEDSKEKDKAPKVKIDDDFCTEPMAQIYAEQGYLEQAKHIYSRLLLKFPEKSAYFAALIERLN